MGIHRFVRAEQFQTEPVMPRRADEPSQNERTFDSDPYRSIAMAFGYRPGSVELREVNRTSDFISYDVYAKSGVAPPEGETDRPAYLIGAMTTKTKSKRFEEMDGRK